MDQRQIEALAKKNREKSLREMKKADADEAELKRLQKETGGGKKKGKKSKVQEEFESNRADKLFKEMKNREF